MKDKRKRRQLRRDYTGITQNMGICRRRTAAFLASSSGRLRGRDISRCLKWQQVVSNSEKRLLTPFGNCHHQRIAICVIIAVRWNFDADLFFVIV